VLSCVCHDESELVAVDRGHELRSALQDVEGVAGSSCSREHPQAWLCPNAAAATRVSVSWLTSRRRARLEAMQQLKAVVKNGRLVIDEPTELPDGTELMLTVVDEADGMDDAERARLHESLRRSIAQAKAGQLVDGDEVIGKLLARR
jgi:hypothetical protein